MTPLGEELPTIARSLVRYADTGNTQRSEVAEGLRVALGANHLGRRNAELVQQQIPAIVREMGAGLETLALSRALRHPGHTFKREPSDGWADFSAELSTYPADESAATLLVAVEAALIRVARNGEGINDADDQTIIRALRNEDAATAMDLGLTHVSAHEPLLVTRLQNQILPAILRSPIGTILGR